MWDNRNNIVHEHTEEYLTHKESKALEDKIIRSHNEGNSEVLSQHKYMFDENIEDILNRTVAEKKYWLLTVQASRDCYKIQQSEAYHECDACSIERIFATVPD